MQEEKKLKKIYVVHVKYTYMDSSYFCLFQHFIPVTDRVFEISYSLFFRVIQKSESYNLFFMKKTSLTINCASLGWMCVGSV